MPLSKYYGGHGAEVMKAMKKTPKSHEKSESSKHEKMETGPSLKVRRKHGV